MAYCGEQVAVKHHERTQVAVSLKCKSWTCAECAEKRKKQLIAQGVGGAPTTFLTLTYRVREGITPNEAAKSLSRAWRLLRLRLMRKYHWRKLPFLCVMEKTKLGWPHLHIMLRTRYIPQAVISDLMQEIIDSPVVHINKITNKAKRAAYCAKYCSKAMDKFDTAKRYWQSRDYDLREPPEEKVKLPPGEGWDMWPVSLTKWIAGQIEIFREVRMLSSCKAISTPRAWDIL